MDKSQLLQKHAQYYLDAQKKKSKMIVNILSNLLIRDNIF